LLDEYCNAHQVHFHQCPADVSSWSVCFHRAAHTCSVCFRAFAIPSNLKRHLKVHAKDVKQPQDEYKADAGEEGDEAIRADGLNEGRDSHTMLLLSGNAHHCRSS